MPTDTPALTGTAETQPDDYVNRFIAHLSDPNISLRTIESGPTGGATSWGTKGKAAILERLSRERDTGVPVADQVCHEEQLSIWAEELLCELECWIEAPETYDDGVQCAQAAKQAIKDIVTTAFDLAAAPQPPTVSPELTDLRQELVEAREALKPFAEAAATYDSEWLINGAWKIPGSEALVEDFEAKFKVGDLRRARAALSPKKDTAPSAEVPA